MFNFFQTIFTKITSAVASVIIAVGLVSAPVPQPVPSPQVETVVEVKQEAQELKKIKLEAELEQVKAETIKVKAEKEKIQREAKITKARAEAEKAQREVEETRIKAEQERLREAQRLADQQEEERLGVQDAQIKIEICKIEAQTSIKNFLEAGKLAANEGSQKCIQNRLSGLMGGGANYSVLEAAMELARSSCNNSAKEGLNFLQSKADEMYNQRYVECLSK